MLKKKLLFTLMVIMTLLALALPAAPVSAATVQTQLDGSTIPQFAQALPILDVTGAANGTIQTIVAGTSQIGIEMKEFKANMLPSGFISGYAGTSVWGYVKAGTDTSAARDTYTGPVIVATRNVPTEIKYINNLGSASTSNVLAYSNSIDQSLEWANPDNQPRYINTGSDDAPVWVGNSNQNIGAIPAAVHLHGAEDPAAIDGGPDSWFTSSGQHGPAFYSKDGNTNGNYAIYRYPNVQEAAPLWFHDHTLGATRLNVYSGLAGGYLLIDPKLKLPAGLNATGLRGGALGPNPADDTIIPLVVQDRDFDTNGQLYFPTGDTAPDRSYWNPEFLGDTISVNGKVWPYLDVKAQRYEFLLINGSNARSYVLSFKNSSAVTNTASPTIWQVATDQGYLDKPVAVNELVIMPGERAQFILDFSGITPGTRLVLNNFGPEVPLNTYPVASEDLADPTTTGKVMQFRVVSGAPARDSSFNPSASGAAIRSGTQTIVRLVNPITGKLASDVKPTLTRSLTLNDWGGVSGTTNILINNTRLTGTQPDPSNPNNLTTAADQSGWLPDNLPTKLSDGTIIKGGNYISETPREGTTEVWEIINMTPDSHPIHTHLAQFQVLNRQTFSGDTAAIIADPTDYVGAGGYFAAYANAFQNNGDVKLEYGSPLAYSPSTASGGKYGGNPDVAPYLNGPIQPPLPNEAGWLDTVRVPPNTVTRLVVRWAPSEAPVASNSASFLRYAFVPNGQFTYKTTDGQTVTATFDYVWHCHIVDHEDNEMMRPDSVIPRTDVSRTFVMGRDY